MCGYEIRDKLLKYPEVLERLRGIVSIDKIPGNLKRMQYVIVNEGDSTSPGIHWFVIFRNLEGSYEIFDSLGKVKNVRY